MIPVDVPVPPMLEECIGYRGPARFFGIYWGAGDEAYFSDGHVTATGNHHGFSIFIYHPAVVPELDGLNLDSSDYEATEWLVIDRHERRAYVGDSRDVRRFLREQWSESPAGPLVVSQEDFAALFDQIQREFEAQPMPTPAEVMAALREQHRLEREMVAWLDQTPQAQRAREGRRKLADGDQATT